MAKSNKKALWISLFSIDAVITLFLFVVSIIMLATMPKNDKEWLIVKNLISTGKANFIQWFQVNTTAYLLICVLPLALLLVFNIVVLVRYVKKLNERKQVALNDLSEEEKEALRRELLNDLGSSKEEK